MPNTSGETTKRKIDDRILERRLDRARFLLTETSESLETVAADCGWRSETAFAADFERRVGVAPARYRRWHQSRFL
ncbi:MAG TPA: helix-turn-helix domain-containing protein [Pyrinomonadaceae bacterium]|jgi:transcriptional regulator GlxA family with amidase domain